LLSERPARGASLPDALGEAGDPGRWVADPPRATELKIGSESLGQWQNRIYRRAAPIASVEVNLMEGKGFGAPYIPGSDPLPDAPPLNKNDVLFPAWSVYETLRIEGKHAVLESSELTGRALSVALGGHRTLLAESVSLSVEELRDFTEQLIRALPAERHGAE
jgi:hypothetical protein